MTSLAVAYRRSDLLDPAAVAACLRDAAAAPSIHNSQPWQFRQWSKGFDIMVDPGRRLEAIDPGGRAATISVGAALFNLRIAILRRGRMAVLRGLASVEVGPVITPDPTVRALAAAIGRRHTNRGPFAPTVVPAHVVDELSAAAAAEGASLALLDPARRDAVLALTRTADQWQTSNVDYRQELAAWTAPRPGRQDGVPPDVFGPLDASGDFPVRDFGLRRSGPHRRRVRFESHPQLVVLYTRHDGVADRLRAGQALQRVLLTATVRGVSAQPMTQALESSTLRGLIVDRSDAGWAQMILRIGYGLSAGASPRRDLTDLIRGAGR